MAKKLLLALTGLMTLLAGCGSPSPHPSVAEQPRADGLAFEPGASLTKAPPAVPLAARQVLGGTSTPPPTTVTTWTANTNGTYGLPHGTTAGFRSMAKWLPDLQALPTANLKFPSLATLVNLGYSYQSTHNRGVSRPVYAIHITGAATTTPKPGVLLTASNHANELTPPEVVYNLAHDLIVNYGTDANVTQVVDANDIWVLILGNPDGRLYTETTNWSWRTNCGSSGVDLNRNYDYNWISGNSSPTATDYRGSAPFSESESQAIRNLNSQHPFNVAMDFRAYGNKFLYPAGFNSTPTADDAPFKVLASNMATLSSSAPQSTSSTSSTPPPNTPFTYSTIYSGNGGALPGDQTDWLYLYGTASVAGKHPMAFDVMMGSAVRPYASDIQIQTDNVRPAMMYLLQHAANPWQP